MKKTLASLPVQIIGALIIGTILGLIFGKSLAPLGEIGKIVITLIKASAAPLLFCVILHSFISTEVDKKSGAKLLLVCAFNGSLALVIGISISKIFRAGEHFNFMRPEKLTGQLAEYAHKKINVLESLKSYFPESLLKPLMDNAIISLVLVAVFFGLVLRHLSLHDAEVKGTISRFVEWLTLGQKVFEKALFWLVKLIPLAVFGVVAKTVGEFGLEPLKGLVIYVGVGLLGLFVHILFVYQGWVLFKGIGLKRFWKQLWHTCIYAFGVNSSLATLPLTLKNLAALKVSKKSATLGACVGTNLNNDGILLYEGMAVFFVAQAMGIEMTIAQQLQAAMICVIGTIGVAGIPEAGFITLSLVLTTVGLPTEILPMLLTVDWIVGRMRSVTNVLGDTIVSIALDPAQKQHG